MIFSLNRNRTHLITTYRIVWLITMNREALPLILVILTPIILVSLILLYLYGYDFTVYLRKIDLIYYIIILPFALGILAALLKVRTPK